MMSQVGLASSAFLRIHNHLNNDQGGILADYSRYGAFRAPSRAGAMALHVDNDADRNTPLNVYTLLKQFVVDYRWNYRGTVQLRWQMFTSVPGQDVGSKAYINGAPMPGAADEVTNLAAPQDYTHDYDVGLASGDLIQIYGIRIGAGGTSCHVLNFRLYYDWSIFHFGDGTTHLLNAALALTDVDPLEISASVGF